MLAAYGGVSWTGFYPNACRDVVYEEVQPWKCYSLCVIYRSALSIGQQQHCYVVGGLNGAHMLNTRFTIEVKFCPHSCYVYALHVAPIYHCLESYQKLPST